MQRDMPALVSVRQVSIAMRLSRPGYARSSLERVWRDGKSSSSWMIHYLRWSSIGVHPRASRTSRGGHARRPATDENGITITAMHAQASSRPCLLSERFFVTCHEDLGHVRLHAAFFSRLKLSIRRRAGLDGHVRALPCTSMSRSLFAAEDSATSR